MSTHKAWSLLVGAALAGAVSCLVVSPLDDLPAKKAAAAAGVMDVEQGADLLADSQDIAIQSALVSALSAADLRRGIAVGVDHDD